MDTGPCEERVHRTISDHTLCERVEREPCAVLQAHHFIPLNLISKTVKFSGPRVGVGQGGLDARRLCVAPSVEHGSDRGVVGTIADLLPPSRLSEQADQFATEPMPTSRHSRLAPTTKLGGRVADTEHLCESIRLTGNHIDQFCAQRFAATVSEQLERSSPRARVHLDLQVQPGTQHRFHRRVQRACCSGPLGSTAEQGHLRRPP